MVPAETKESVISRAVDQRCTLIRLRYIIVCVCVYIVFSPGLGKGLPFIFINPQDISKRGNGRCILFNMMLVVEERDLKSRKQVIIK